MIRSDNEIVFERFAPEEVDKRFDQILNELRDEKDVTKINKRIANLSGGFQLYATEFNFEGESFLRIYRVTKNYPNLEESIHLPSSFLNPPPEGTKLGRANLKNHPVFYGAIAPKTAIEESDLNSDETFYLSEWVFPLNTKVRAFVLTYDSKKRDGFFNQTLDKSINIMLGNLSEEQIQWFKYRQKRIIDLFTFEGSQYYNISSAMAHNYLYLLRDKIVETPMIVYPSVTKTGNEYNFAIHPSFVKNEERFRLVSVLKCKCEESEEGTIIYEKGINNDNKISWGKLQVKFGKADIDEFNFFDSGTGMTSTLYSKEHIFVFENSEMTMYDYLDNFIKNHLSKYIEQEMKINFKLFNVFEPKTNILIKESFKCPFQETVLLKEQGSRINSVTIQVEYEVTTQ
jgi:hypothetical protein